LIVLMRRQNDDAVSTAVESRTQRLALLKCDRRLRVRSGNDGAFLVKCYPSRHRGVEMLARARQVCYEAREHCMKERVRHLQFSLCIVYTGFTVVKDGRVAQLAEQLTLNQ
jgi:hypothetical protein